MSAVVAHSALRGVRRTTVIVIIVAVAISAILGIVMLLTGGWGDVQGRILATTFAIAVFAVTALCHLVQADRPLRTVGFVGIAASVLALIPILIIIWDTGSFSSDTYSWLLKGFGFFTVLAASLAQANLLLLFARRRQRAVRSVLVVALVFIGIVAIMIWLPILTEGEIPGDQGDWYWRLFGVAAIIDVLCTIVLPVLGLVLKESRDGVVSLVVHAPAALVAEIDARATAEGSTRAAVVEAALGRGLKPDGQ